MSFLYIFTFLRLQADEGLCMTKIKKNYCLLNEPVKVHIMNDNEVVSRSFQPEFKSV